MSGIILLTLISANLIPGALLSYALSSFIPFAVSCIGGLSSSLVYVLMFTNIKAIFLEIYNLTESIDSEQPNFHNFKKFRKQQLTKIDRLVDNQSTFSSLSHALEQIIRLGKIENKEDDFLSKSLLIIMECAGWPIGEIWQVRQGEWSLNFQSDRKINKKALNSFNRSKIVGLIENSGGPIWTNETNEKGQVNTALGLPIRIEGDIEFIIVFMGIAPERFTKSLLHMMIIAINSLANIIEHIRDSKGPLEEGSHYLTRDLCVGLMNDIDKPIEAISLNMNELKSEIKQNINPAADCEKIVTGVIEITKTIHGAIEHLREISTQSATFRRTGTDTIINKIIEMMRPKLEAKNIELRLSGEKLLYLDCSPHQIIQCLANIIDYSTDSENVSQPPNWLSINTTRIQDHICFDISTSIPIINKELAKDTISHFFLINDDNTKVRPGLAITENVVKQHNGSIRFLSNDQNRIRLTIPEHSKTSKNQLHGIKAE